MSGAETAGDEVRRHLAAHGKFLRGGDGGSELWSVANRVTVQLPGRKGDDAGWLGCRAKIRAALRAAGIDRGYEEAAPVAKTNGTAYDQDSAIPIMKVRTRDDAPAAENARALAEKALTIGEEAEALAAKVEGLVDALNAERRRAEKAEDARDLCQRKLDLAQAELGRFNGRDWPKELEQAVEQRKKAQAEAAALQAKITHMETALRSMSLAGFGGSKPA